MPILQKVIDANAYVNGAAIVGSDKVGNIEKLAQTINDNTGIGALTGVLETRFDEPRYYTGDAIT
jgi:hypothetical protein